MEDPLISLYKIIQRRYKLAKKEKVSDFETRFRRLFEELCNLISSLSEYVTLKDFKKLLGPSKIIPVAFLNNQEELVKISKTIEDLQQLTFNNYEILEIIGISLGFLENDKNNEKLDAFLELLERLFII